MPDQKFEELEPKLLEVLATGGTFWGKFTCEDCGSRQTFEQKEKLFTSGICEECGHETQLSRWGFIALLGKDR